MPVTTQPPPFDRQSGAGDVAALHSRQVARLVAFLCSSNRHAGAREAEDVACEAFLEVASTWPRIGGHSSPEIYLFASAHRIAVARNHLGRSGRGDALAESMPAFGDQADLARLAVLQDALDQLPAAPRYAVLLREMCGFSPKAGAEIIGLPESTVELARDDALRTLVPVVESGTAAVLARRGPLSPDDFAALSRVLQHPDADRVVERRRLSERLSGRSPHGTGPIPTGGVPLGRSTAGPGWDSSAGQGYPGQGYPGPGYPGQGRQLTTGGFELQPGWSRTTPLDAPLSTVDLSSTSTPIFDAISAWFASDATGAGNKWAALDDGGWRAATARAAAEPQVAGVSDAGLPKRRPGANAVPSAAEVGPLTRGMFGEPPRPDAGQVRHRLDSFQQGVNTARRLRGRLNEQGDAAAAGAAVPPEPERPWDPLFDPMPARRSSDGQRVAATGLPTQQGAPEPAVEARTGDGRDDAAFRTFQREHMPQLLAALLLEGAHPVTAAELAQEVFDEAYWNWATLQSPHDWVRERAMALLAHRRGTRS
jgi:DNA-directed RNA polymerase specialized sigma24 family protein